MNIAGRWLSSFTVYILLTLVWIAPCLLLSPPPPHPIPSPHPSANSWYTQFWCEFSRKPMQCRFSGAKHSIPPYWVHVIIPLFNYTRIHCKYSIVTEHWVFAWLWYLWWNCSIYWLYSCSSVHVLLLSENALACQHDVDCMCLNAGSCASSTMPSVILWTLFYWSTMVG